MLFCHRRTLALAVFSTAGTAILWFAWPLMFRELTDAAIAGEVQRFLPLILISFAAVLLEAISQYFRGISVAKLSAYAMRDMRNRLTTHIQRLPVLTLENYHSGDLVSRFNNDIEETSALYRRAPDYVYRTLQISIGLALMIWISPILTLVICASMPISVFIFERFVRPMQKHSGDKMKALASANASLTDAIRGASVVRAFGLQRILAGRFRKQIDDVERHDMKNQVRANLSFIPFLALRYIPQLIVPIYGGLLAFRGEISVGDLLAINWLIWTIFEPLETFLAWIREVRQAAPALTRIFELLDSPPERSDGRELSPEGGDPIAFEDVTFSYNGAGPVLESTSFQVRPGESVALVGPSGCGKTTLLKAVCGFVEPSSGTIRLFGEDLGTIAPSSARSHISWMTQDPFLFPLSIEQNIAHGRPGATHEQIVAAAQSAHASGFIEKLEQGYETNVGELGSRLSVGQKQRICLARAILKDAPILLLDEPTAALDTESETTILDALEGLMREKTTILISHRISTLRNADRILLLQDGAIQATGTHDQLMASSATYRQLAERQVLTDGNGGGT